MNDYIKNIIKDMENMKNTYGYDSLSVQEVIYLPAFKEVKILGGSKGLTNLCNHITILETPEGLNWMKGGEIVLTAGYALYNNKEAKRNMMYNAYKKGVSAVLIKSNRYFGEVDSKLIEDADKFNLPLIEIPDDVFYTDAVSSFYDLLFYRKNEYILNLNNVYEKLLNLSFENKDIVGIIYSLSNISNSNVFLLDDKLNILESVIIDSDSDKDTSSNFPFEDEVKKLMKDTSKPCLNYDIGHSYLSVYPIVRNGSTVAFLYLVTDRELSALDQTSIEYGKSIISMKMEKEWIIEVRQTNFNKTLVETMLNNDDLTDEFYRNVEKDLGWDKKGQFTGICIKTYDTHEGKDVNFSIYDILDELLGVDNYLSLKKHDETFLFIKLESNTYLKDIIDDIKKRIDSHLTKVVVTIGVSDYSDNLREMKKLYNESYLAALFEKDSIVYYELLNTMKLLYPLREDEEIKNYYSRTIEKLEIYDQDNTSNLLETIEAYFRYDLNKKVTAAKLFIHVETLRYRLKRIEEITGYSTSNTEDVFSLQMGLKLKKIMKMK